MTITTKTNAQVDTAAAAVGAEVGGPLTRVSSIEDLTPNSHIKIQFTTAIDDTPVTMTYDELVDQRTRDRILFAAHSGHNINAPLEHLRRVIHALDAQMETWAFPYSDSERAATIDILRTIPDIIGQPYNHPYPHVDAAAPVANFTVVDADAGGAGLAADVTETSTGEITYWRWDWGDGTYSVGESPANHTYAAADTYDITLTVVGPGGSSQVTKPVTVA